MRVKLMPQQKFAEVMKREWAPVKLVGEAVPEWLKGIPTGVVHSIYASGTQLPGISYSNTAVSAASLIGGIHVYRNAPDDPVELNKDWYAVVAIPNSDSMLLVLGPNKDAEHWLNEIPGKLKGAEILGVPASNLNYPMSASAPRK